MARPAFTIGEDASLDDALRVFHVCGERHLAVVDSVGSCVGLLGDRVIAPTWIHLIALLATSEPAPAHSPA